MDRLIIQQDIKNQCRTLLGFVRYIVESVKGSKEDIKQIAPSEGTGYCTMCGLNHEARDFIRAILLYLLDQFEVSSYYLEFLREQNYIHKDHYNKYYNLIQTNLGKRKSKGPMTDGHFTRSETNEEQIMPEPAAHEGLKTERQITLSKTEEERVADAWFEGLKGTIKKIVEYTLSEKPKMSKVQIMHSIRDRMIETHNRSELDGAKGFAEGLGLTLPLELIIAYRHRKAQTEYENKPEIREIRIKLRKKRRRAKSQQTASVDENR